MILPDHMIRALGKAGKIRPYARGRKRPGKISFGESSAGYDIRLGKNFKIFANTCAVVVDPKNFDPASFVNHSGKTCIIPPNSFVLAESVEWFCIPDDCIGIVLGKSTYARCGICTNFTPLEPGWCTAPDTEALTESGWKLLSEVVTGERILTRREDGLAEYQPVLATQSVRFGGDLLHFDGRSVDQLVTPDHELFAHRWTGHRVVTGKVPAAEVFGRHNYSFDRQVSWFGPRPNRLELAGRSWDAGDFLEFYGSWLGDGSAYLGTDGGYHVKLAVVTKEEKRRRFNDCLTRLGFKFRLHERGFHFHDKRLCLWLRENGHATDKYIRREFLSLHPLLLDRLLGGLMQSDGCALTNTYTTTSRRLADDVQELIFKCGRAAIVRDVTEETTFGRCRRYVVRDCDDQMTPKMRPERHKKEPYSGMVYDVTVPNHVFFCRRQGKASWTGNCGNITVEIANTTPLPAKVYAGEGIAQVLFLRIDGRPEVTYRDKRGKYQAQKGLTLPKVD